MQRAIDAFLLWLAATNHSLATVRNRRASLDRFAHWAHRYGVRHPGDLDLPDLEAYRLVLHRATRRDGQPLGWGTQAEHLSAVKVFLAWCVRHGHCLRNPAEGFRLPRRPVQLPRAILTHAEAERVLRQPRRHTATGLRDRAILELLYSSGLRRAELAHLRTGDVDEGRRLVMVRAGKGQRDRVVPLGQRALRWVRRYLRCARPRLDRAAPTDLLFLTARGRGLRLNRLSERVRGYVAAAALGKTGSCHLFRHTMATLLLEGGAGIRDVQEILGHTNLSTTARYTHIAIGRLQAVHARAHPAERGRTTTRGRRRR
jgi:integrase/recombinase XerD